MTQMYNSNEEKKRTETGIFNLSKFPEENPNPVLRVRQDGVILYANSSSAPLLKRWRSKVGKRLPQPYLDTVTRTFQTRKSETVEVECYGRTYSFLLVPVTDTDYVHLYGRDITEIRQAEESLRKSEGNFRRSLDESPLGIRIVDDDGETLYANRALLDIYGYENIDELKNTPVKERYTPESYAEYKLRKQKRQRNEYVPLEYEVSILRKNGETRHLKVFRKEVLWNDKKHFQTMYEDVTERKQAEEELSKREATLQKVFDLLPIGLWFADKDGVLLRGNPAGVRIWGAEPKVGPPEYGVFKARRLPSGEDIAPDDWALAHTVKKGITIENELLEIDAFDGQKRIILNFTAPVLDDKGEVQGAIVVNQDITEPKRAEEALRKSEEKYRTIFERSMDAIYVVATDGTFIDGNQRWLDLYGYTREEMMGMNARQLYANPADRDKFRWDMEQKGSVENYELQLRRKDGRLIYGVISATTQLAGDGTPVYHGITHDITRRKRAENQTELSLRVLQILNRSEDTREIIREILLLVKAHSGCSAMGIRLREGEDFPYYEANGFSESHLALENHLCAVDQKGELLRDSQGNPILECMCGNIICGRFDPTKPFFTQGGSFWTNSTTDLLASTSEEDRQARTCNRCHGEGYESVALIPLKAEQGIVGLLQLNDFQPNRFTPELISFYEGIANSIGVVLARKQAEELIKTLAQSSPIGIYIVQDGKFQYVNRPFTKTMGYTTEQLLGKNPLDFVHPDDREMVRSNAILMMKGKLSYSYEYRVFSNRGEIKWIVENVASIQYRGKQATLGNFIDVTELKQAEEALRSSEERLRIIFESVPEGIVLSDLQGRYLQVNEATVRMLGFDDKKQIIGRNVYEFISEKDHDLARKRRERAREFEPVKGAAITLKRKDGSEFPAESSVSAVRDASGNPIGFVSVMKDVTEHRRMEELLMRADRLSSIGELASGIAHELNNPLTGVIGFSDLLLEKDVPEDIKEDLKVINREAHRTAGVVKNLLTFARKHPEEKQLVDIHSVIQGTLELRKYEHKISNIQIITRLSPDLPEVMANDFQLRQVFLNIIVNAEFFMIEAHGKGTLTITTEQVDNSIRVSFADDGPGIAPENLRKIFDPFFTTKEVGKGTGLGLSICHGIIVAHNGRIYAESQPGKGATFIVELPVSR